MTTQPYEPHWEMHGRTRKQHLVIYTFPWWECAFLHTVCGLVTWRMEFPPGNYERGVDRCRSCDRSAT